MDNNVELSRISIYPIKSTAPTHQSRAWVENKGLAFDRRFVVTEPDGTFMTARKHPKLARVDATLTADGLLLSAPGQTPLAVRYTDFSDRYQPVQVWSDHFQGLYCCSDYDQWFSDYLDQPCQLLFMGEQAIRSIEAPGKQVSFADAYPLLLISEASLEGLNARLSEPVKMERFRPNIVVNGCDSFAEDSWKTIRIGEVTFEVINPCSRCIFTTLDPANGKFDENREPLATLQKFRRGTDEDSQNDVFFGQNLVPLNEGLIKQGDRVEILETQPPVNYIDHSLAESLPASESKPVHQSRIKNQSNRLAWTKGQQLNLRCVRVIEETADVKTFRFQTETDHHVDYQPGQYLTLLLNIDGNEIRRCYTLSSSPTRLGHFSITVKRVTDGLVSNWLHDNLQEGSRVEAIAPEGEFHWYAADKTDKALLLSAGSGITPMLSMARYLSDTQSEAKTVFMHSARTEADLISRTELDLLAKQHSQLSLAYTLTGDTSSHWQGGSGRLDKQRLLEVVPDISEYTVFVCGPAAFMESAKKLVMELGVPEQRYFEESFGFNSGPVKEAEKEVSLLFDSWDTHVMGNNQRTILEQGEDAGLDMAYSCRAGICGQCKVKVVSGEYQSFADDALSEQEKSENYVLACSCRPLSDMVIEAG
ncbi:hybrid-cluster NAD(P)-dependent oxidoreductase [Motiliproteus sp. MSK22-1]|uniref:hybrid-cluster NAD(P)-dependent oxidoreductase n=1 Tax=Motiliproteus sp. MSK22-1 TaxID=1897630 RepID=UPI0009F94BB0|nr:hybrid-cluster NAD(P)-dependent oxidoreductase [Motiliproteus sp. MSK22-1]